MQFVINKISNYSPDRPADWDEVAQEMRRKYGASGYQLIQHQEIVWNGYLANVCESEIE